MIKCPYCAAEWWTYSIASSICLSCGLIIPKEIKESLDILVEKKKDKAIFLFRDDADHREKEKQDAEK